MDCHVQPTMKHLITSKISSVERSTLDSCFLPYFQEPSASIFEDFPAWRHVAPFVISLHMQQPELFGGCISQLEELLDFNSKFCCSSFAVAKSSYAARYARRVIKVLSGQITLEGQLHAVVYIKKAVKEWYLGCDLPDWCTLLASRPSIIFSHLADNWLRGSLGSGHAEKIPVIQYPNNHHYELLKQLIMLVESGDSFERDQALSLVQVLKITSKYAWMDVRDIAEDLPSSPSKSSILQTPDWGKHCKSPGDHHEKAFLEQISCQILSHQNAEGKVHVYFACDDQSKFPRPLAHCHGPHTHKIVIDLRDIAWVENQTGEPLEEGAHHFISAGVGPTEEPLYLASRTTLLANMWFSTVSIGATSIGYYDLNHKHFDRTEKFYVLALRHSPEVLLAVHPAIPKDTSYSTGPFYWSKVSEESTYYAVECPDCRFAEVP